MDQALIDVRNEYRTLYGSEPDERFETLLSRVWRDGYDDGRSAGITEIIEFAEEIR